MYKTRNRELNGYFTVLVLWGVMIFGKAKIYIVTLEGEPVVSYRGGVDGFEATAVDSYSDGKIDVTSELVISYAHHLEKQHDMLLDMLFDQGAYKKLYSYNHLINGFAVHISSEQAEILRRAPGVKSVERDWKVKKLTTHTPQFWDFQQECGLLEVALTELERILFLALLIREFILSSKLCNSPNRSLWPTHKV